MRQGSHSKRSRGRGGNRRSGTPNRNHTFDSNGPDIRIRGNAHQVHEKYINLAREASTNGEVVLAEGYFQHAEHYFRILSAFSDDSNSDGNKNRSNTSAVQDNTNNGSQNSNSQTPSVTKTEPRTGDNSVQLDDENSKQSELAVVNETKKPNGDARGSEEEAEVTIQDDQPTLALRSDERLNIGNSANETLVASEPSQTLKLENTPTSKSIKTGQSGERKRRPRVNGDSDLTEK